PSSRTFLSGSPKTAPSRKTAFLRGCFRGCFRGRFCMGDPGQECPGLASPSFAFLPLEVDEEATKVVRILLDPVVERLDIFSVEESQYFLLELARSLSGNDFDHRSFPVDRLLYDLFESPVDILSPVIDIVQIE